MITKKQFITCAFMIAATKGKKDVLSDKHLKEGEKDFQSLLCSPQEPCHGVLAGSPGERRILKNTIGAGFQDTAPSLSLIRAVT